MTNKIELVTGDNTTTLNCVGMSEKVFLYVYKNFEEFKKGNTVWKEKVTMTEPIVFKHICKGYILETVGEAYSVSSDYKGVHSSLLDITEMVKDNRDFEPNGWHSYTCTDERLTIPLSKNDNIKTFKNGEEYEKSLKKDTTVVNLSVPSACNLSITVTEEGYSTVVIDDVNTPFKNQEEVYIQAVVGDVVVNLNGAGKVINNKTKK